MGIGIGGLISGLDSESLISQMMEIERQPVVQLQRDEAFYQSKISAVGTLKGGLSALQSSLTALTDAASFTAVSVTSGNTSAMTVTGAADANVGEYQVEVNGLAQAQQVRSSAFTGSDQVVGNGTLTIQVGSGTAFDITIDSSNETLAGIADAINAAGTDVMASVIDDGNGNFYLTMASKNSGTANTITMTMTDGDGDNTDAAGLSSLYTTPLTGALTQTQPPLNAMLKVNGIDVERSSNTIDDLLDGLTLTVNATDPGNPFTVTVAEDLDSVTSKVSAFVNQYNSLMSSLTSLQSYDADTGASGTLQGDSTTRSIQTRIQSMLHLQVDGVATSVNGLSALGMEIDKNGEMSLDTTVLTTALQDNRSDVTNFFSQNTVGSEGFAVQFDSLITSYISSSGLLAAKEDGLSSSITDIETHIDNINTRLVKKEDTLRMQFQVLETLLANFEQTSGILTGQLNSLDNLNSQIYK